MLPSRPEQKSRCIAGSDGTDVAADPTPAPPRLMYGPPFPAGLTKLVGPPKVPISSNLYRWCPSCCPPAPCSCATSAIGTVSTTQYAIETLKNILFFIRLLPLGVGARRSASAELANREADGPEEMPRFG